MAIVSTEATVSHRYYAKKPKAEIRRRIVELARLARVMPPSDLEMMSMSAEQLASRAMAFHAVLRA